MTWVKICGMTNLEDALVAVEAGADAVGFVFYEKSPRCVSAETAREIVEKLPESVEKVGVFAGESMEDAVGTARFAGFDALQTYPLTSLRLGADDKSPGKAMGIDGLKVYWALPIEVFLGEGARKLWLDSRRQVYLRNRSRNSFIRWCSTPAVSSNQAELGRRLTGKPRRMRSRN